jgi:AcrR family transcriptional regulator
MIADEPTERPALSDHVSTRRKYRTASKSALSRMQILDAAAQIFGRRGYSDTTLRQIAEAAGMQAGSIYYHFASKDEIFDEVLSTGMRTIHKTVAGAVASLGDEASHRSRIERAMTAHLELLLMHRNYFAPMRILHAQMPETLMARHMRLRQEYGKLWDAMLRAAQEDGEIHTDAKIVHLRMVILGALNWTLEWFDADQYAIDHFVDQMSQFIFDGVGLKTARRTGKSRSGK